jgi:hypothetical protein
MPIRATTPGNRLEASIFGGCWMELMEGKCVTEMVGCWIK